MRAKKSFKNYLKKITLPKIRIIPPKISFVPIFKGLFYLFATLSMLIWIFIGGAFSIFLFQSLRQGSLTAMLKPTITQQNQQDPQENKEEKTEQQKTQVQQPPQEPTEANIPGVGRVNINCVKNALPETAIKNLIVSGNTSVLTADEKVRFEKCLVR